MIKKVLLKRLFRKRGNRFTAKNELSRDRTVAQPKPAGRPTNTGGSASEKRMFYGGFLLRFAVIAADLLDTVLLRYSEASG